MILVLRDKSELDESVRRLVFTVLAVVCAFGTLILIVLRPSLDAEGRENEVKKGVMAVNPKQELKASMRLLLTRDMSLLSIIFFFTGKCDVSNNITLYSTYESIMHLLVPSYL